MRTHATTSCIIHTWELGRGARWRHYIDTLSIWLAFCEENHWWSPLTKGQFVKALVLFVVVNQNTLRLASMWCHCDVCPSVFISPTVEDLNMMTSSNENLFRATGSLCGEFATGIFPSQRPVTRSFDVFFDLHLNIRLSKQSRGRWSETPSRSLWQHCNDKNNHFSDQFLQNETRHVLTYWGFVRIVTFGRRHFEEY